MKNALSAGGFSTTNEIMALDWDCKNSKKSAKRW